MYSGDHLLRQAADPTSVEVVEKSIRMRGLRISIRFPFLAQLLNQQPSQVISRVKAERIERSKGPFQLSPPGSILLPQYLVRIP